MPNPVTALVVGGTSLVSSYVQGQGAKSAADTQAGAAQAGIAEQRSALDRLQALLKPYVDVGAPAISGLKPYAEAGVPAFEQQQALLGLRGPDAERAAIERISGGARFQEVAQQGEEALLQRASATGGLRGGNIQGALAQYRPALLSSMIEQQYGKLGGLADIGRETQTNLAKIGQASAAGVGAQGVTTGTNVANLLGQQGQAIAGGQLGEARAYGQMLNLPAQFLGMQMGAGGKAGMGFGTLFGFG
jgi:hypothetical protein